MNFSRTIWVSIWGNMTVWVHTFCTKIGPCRKKKKKCRLGGFVCSDYWVYIFEAYISGNEVQSPLNVAFLWVLTEKQSLWRLKEPSKKNSALFCSTSHVPSSVVVLWLQMRKEGADMKWAIGEQEVVIHISTIKQLVWGWKGRYWAQACSWSQRGGISITRAKCWSYCEAVK